MAGKTRADLVAEYERLTGAPAPSWFNAIVNEGIEWHIRRVKGEVEAPPPEVDEGEDLTAALQRPSPNGCDCLSRAIADDDVRWWDQDARPHACVPRGRA